jgi:hypothetical protein
MDHGASTAASRDEIRSLHCHEEGDGFGSSEAYLWTIYFKIDGDSVFLGDDLFLHGNCSLFPTPGSHGNLGDSDIDAGDDVPVPSTIGEFHTMLNPIPVPAWVRDVFGVEDIGGVVGVAVRADGRKLGFGYRRGSWARRIEQLCSSGHRQSHSHVRHW